MNPRITKKERGLLKGVIRRIFSRSELHKSVKKDAVVSNYSDGSRPRVKTWCGCAGCYKIDAISNLVVDHIDPVIPVNSSLEHMSFDNLIDRIWCDKTNLQVLCDSCHNNKTKVERRERTRFKKNRCQRNKK
jgi:hypothetical protein